MSIPQGDDIIDQKDKQFCFNPFFAGLVAFAE